MAEGADGNLLVPIQAGNQHIPKGQSRAQRQGRRHEGRHLHLPAAGMLLHAATDPALGAVAQHASVVRVFLYKCLTRVIQSNMGIYTTIQPCGCEIESYLGYDTTSVCFPCVTHGGNPTVIAGRQARRWAGPKNPYANPEDSVTNVPLVSLNKSAKNTQMK